VNGSEWADLAINLLAALIGITTGWLTRGATRACFSRRPASKVWGLPRGTTANVIVTDVSPPSAGARSIAMVHPAEFAAATELSYFLSSSLLCHVKKVYTSDSFPDSVLDENLVVIGGPVNNRVFRTMSERLALPYHFVDRRLVSHTRGATHTPTSDMKGNLKTDVGLIVVTSNPLDDSSRIILLAGCRTFGSLGAARMLTLPSVRKLAKLVDKKHGYCFVIRMMVEGSFVGQLEVLEWQQLATPAPPLALSGAVTDVGPPDEPR
jgi:hypothetical protein